MSFLMFTLMVAIISISVSFLWIMLEVPRDKRPPRYRFAVGFFTLLEALSIAFLVYVEQKDYTVIPASVTIVTGHLLSFYIICMDKRNLAAKQLDDDKESRSLDIWVRGYDDELFFDRTVDNSRGFFWFALGVFSLSLVIVLTIASLLMSLGWLS